MRASAVDALWHFSPARAAPLRISTGLTVRPLAAPKTYIPDILVILPVSENSCNCLGEFSFLLPRDAL